MPDIQSANEDIKRYIKESLAADISLEQIKKHLLEAGWQLSDIEAAIQDYFKNITCRVGSKSIKKEDVLNFKLSMETRINATSS